MASKKKNRNGVYVISIQSLGFNTTYGTRTTKLSDANRIQREIERRIDTISVDGSHAFHEWLKTDQLVWIKKGVEPKSATAPTTVFEAIDKFLEHARVAGKAPSTLYGYRLHLDAAKEFFNDVPLTTLTSRRLQDWAGFLAKTIILKGRNCGKYPKPETIKKKLDQLKSVVKWFYGLGEPNLHPEAFNVVTVSVKQASILDQLEKWVDFETRQLELKKFGIDLTIEGAFSNIFYSKAQLDEHRETFEQKLYIDGTPAAIRLYCSILIACATGARRSELTRIRRQDLSLDDELPMLTLTKMKGRKNNPYLRQKMPLPPFVLPYLKKLLKILPVGQHSLFNANDEHLTADGFNEDTVRGKASYLTEKINEALKDTKWEHAAGWHIYRHTLASQLLMAGYSQTEVMNLIGWCSEEMARKYQHTTHAHKAAMVNGIFA